MHSQHTSTNNCISVMLTKDEKIREVDPSILVEVAFGPNSVGLFTKVFCEKQKVSKRDFAVTISVTEQSLVAGVGFIPNNLAIEL